MSKDLEEMGISSSRSTYALAHDRFVPLWHVDLAGRHRIEASSNFLMPSVYSANPLVT